MKKTNSAPSEWESSSLPVWRQNAWKSFTEPGSVAVTLSTWPDCSSPSAFLARRMGSGQLRPFTSSSRSAVVTVVTYILRAVAYFNIGLRQDRIKVYHSRTGATAAPGAPRGQDGVRPSSASCSSRGSPMDTVAPALPVSALRSHLGTAQAPLVLDVRRAEALAQDDGLIAGATWRDPFAVQEWARFVPRHRPVVVYCVHGH